MRKKVCDWAKQLLFQCHREAFLQECVPLLNRPEDKQKENIMVTIPGMAEQKQLVFDDIDEVPIEVCKEVLDGCW